MPRLSNIKPWGPSSSIRLYVGLNPGKQPHNVSSACGAPAAEDVYEAFVTKRNATLPGNVGATAMTVRGWYESNPESTAIIETFFVPTEAEPTWEVFCQNLHRRAEDLKVTFCQDSVLILHDHQGSRWAAGAEGAERAYGRSLLKACSPPKT